MRVTVTRDHKILKVEGLAHNDQSEVIRPKKIVVTIEKEGHGVYPHFVKKPDLVFKRYSPQEYTLRSMKEIWDRRHTKLFKGTFTYRGMEYPEKFDCDKWCIFNIGGARPAWAWEISKKNMAAGEWYFSLFGNK